MKMKNMKIIGAFAVLALVLGLGIYSQFRGGRDTGLIKLDKVLEEVKLAAIPGKEVQDFSAEFKGLKEKKAEVAKVKKNTASGFSKLSQYQGISGYKELEYIKNLERAGIQVKKHEQMSSTSKLVSNYYKEQNYPKLEKHFTKELPENYVPGAIIVKRVTWRDGGEYDVSYDMLNVEKGQELDAISELENENDIVTAEADIEIPFETGSPGADTGLRVMGEPGDDPGYAQQWGLDKIEAPDAWEVEKGEDTVNIAVIDTGCDLEHEDLAANIDLDLSYDYVDDDATPEDEYAESHGTHVAGIIAAVGNNGIGISGVMWNANLIILRVLNQQGELDISTTTKASVLADAISEAVADKDAKIINMSCGTTEDIMADSNVLKDAFQAAFAKDVLIIAAAGNDEADGVLYPAKYEDVLAVGATDMNDERVSQTAYGDEIDISAPGEGIYSTLKDNSYGYMDGTSMAAAFVTGAAGLLLSKNPNLNKGQIRMLLTESADELTQEGMGSGRLNAKKALEAFEAGVGELVAVAYVGGKEQKEITVNLDEEVQFYGEDSKGPEGAALTYHWSFGDGEISDGENPVHTYTKKGEYEVILVVSSGGGFTPATDFVTVTVGEDSGNTSGEGGNSDEDSGDGEQSGGSGGGGGAAHAARMYNYHKAMYDALSDSTSDKYKSHHDWYIAKGHTEDEWNSYVAQEIKDHATWCDIFSRQYRRAKGEDTYKDDIAAGYRANQEVYQNLGGDDRLNALYKKYQDGDITQSELAELKKLNDLRRAMGAQAEILNNGTISAGTELAETTPPPVEETPPPAEETPPPAEETPPPVEETPPPVEEPSQQDGQACYECIRGNGYGSTTGCEDVCGL